MIWVVQKWLRTIRICDYIVLNIIVIVESESGGVAQNGQVRVEYANIEVYLLTPYSTMNQKSTLWYQLLV